MNLAYEWRALRLKVISEVGGCERCGAIEDLSVHHIKPRATHPELILERSNLEVLCQRCHKMAHEQTGRSAAAARRAQVHGDKHPISSRRLAHLRKMQRINKEMRH